ncbi:MAG: insulinase family protein [Candidatus Obscuribacter sp.]|nr:insulinase family protein [Candidatus Obscuribacter sp.]
MKTQTDMVSNERLSALGLTLIKERNGISEYKLNANGLKILLIPNQSSQAATVMIVYRVGSRNEAVGYTGSTHFLEHMMFKGTDRFPNFDGVLTPLGADYNATTSYDRTNYFAKVPTEHVGKVIALEADRMRNLNLRQDHRNSEMTVVRNEFENGKNSPFSVLIEQLGATAFDAHPYHHPIIGWLSDVENVPLARLKAFYDEFYWPNNATVMVTGNYGTDDDVLKTIVDEFGAIPASPHAIPEVYTVEAPQLGERRFAIEQESTDPAVVVMGFRVPGAAHKDSAALDVIAGMLGSSSRMASRLYQSLVETGLAVEAFIWPNTQRDEYLLRIGAIPTPGTTLEQLEEALMAQLNKLAREEASPEELAKVKKASRKSRLLGADSQMSLVSKICEMEVASSWEFYLDYDALIDAVTAQDVRDVASRYFVKKNRTTGHFLPQQSVADQPTGGEAKALSDTSTAARASLTAGLVEKVLDNGFKIQVLPLDGAGTVGVSIKLRAGDHFAPADKPLVPTLVAEMLTKGAKHLNLSQMAAILEEMGTRIGFSTDKLAVSCSGKVVGEDFAAYIKILADCLKNPLFPAAQLAQVKEQMRANLSQGLSDPDSIASVTMSQKLFAEGSFHREHSAEELLASLDAITVDDLKAFHKAYYGPRSALITVTGDVQADSAMQPSSTSSASGRAVLPTQTSTSLPPLLRQSPKWCEWLCRPRHRCQLKSVCLWQPKLARPSILSPSWPMTRWVKTPCRRALGWSCAKSTVSHTASAATSKALSTATDCGKLASRSIPPMSTRHSPWSKKWSSNTWPRASATRSSKPGRRTRWVASRLHWTPPCHRAQPQQLQLPRSAHQLHGHPGSWLSRRHHAGRQRLHPQKL